MNILQWATDPWGQRVPIHIAWFLIQVAFVSALAFAIVHAVYIRFFAGEKQWSGTTAPEVLPASIQQSGLLGQNSAGQGSNRLTEVQVEKLFGSHGAWVESRNTVGGQVWLDYSETWRIAGKPNEFFLADGHIPFRQIELDPDHDKPFLSWSVITFAQDCLPK